MVRTRTVLRVRDGAKVLKADTRAVATDVVYFEASRNESIRGFPDDAMNERETSRPVMPTPDADVTVAFRIDSASPDDAFTTLDGLREDANARRNRQPHSTPPVCAPLFSSA